MPELLPDSMGAVLLNGFGGFEQLEYRKDAPVPRPGKGQVLIRVGAAGVNNTDINTRIGWYSKAVEGATSAGVSSGFSEALGEGWSGSSFVFPRIQGADAAGTIVAVGEGVAAERVAQRVLVEPVLRNGDGSVGYLGSECDGAFAEFVVVAADQAHAITSDLTDSELASFPCSYSAAENMIDRAGVRAGERVLVTGASGGVGSAAVQLAGRRGARVTALAAVSKHEALLGLGVEAVLDRHAPLAENSFDVVIDVVGGIGFSGLLQALTPFGRYATAGAIAGPLAELDLRTLYLKDLTLFGCTVFPPGLFRNLVSYIERGEIRPIVCATFPLDRIVAAQRMFLEKRHVGKIVLVPGRE